MQAVRWKTKSKNGKRFPKPNPVPLCDPPMRSFNCNDVIEDSYIVGQVNSDVKLFIRENNKQQNLMLQSVYMQCIVYTIKPYYSFERHLDICTVLGMLESMEKTDRIN